MGRLASLHHSCCSGCAGDLPVVRTHFLQLVGVINLTLRCRNSTVKFGDISLVMICQ
jgi:hypothetical protein